MKWFFAGLFFLAVLLFFGCLEQGTEVVNKPNPELCSNGVLDSGEYCDGTNFGNLSCQSFGFSGGELSCNGCLVEVTGCNNVQLSGRTEKQPIVEQECISPTGLVGKTGETAQPKVYYEWNWEKGSYKDCFFDDPQNPAETFCDSAQFTIYLMEALQQLSANSVDKVEFYGNFLEDGLSDDFRQDFYHYYRNIAFLKAPTYYHETLQGLLLDESKLKFVPSEIKKAGTYKGIVSKNGEQWVVKLDYLQGPFVQSAFYSFPIDGEIGLTLREGESTPNRIGYGVGFSGDQLVFPEFTISTPVDSDHYNVVVKKDFSFAQTNLEKRSNIIELDLQKGKLNVLNSNPNLFMVGFSSLPKKARKTGAPFIVLTENGKGVLETGDFPNYSNWYFLSTPNQCLGTEYNFFGKTIADARLAEVTCGFTDPDNGWQRAAHGLLEFENSSAVVGTIFYSNQNLELSGLCGTQFTPVLASFLGREFLVSASSKNARILGNSSPVDISTSLFSGISPMEKCIYNDGPKSTVYWNEDLFVNGFPDCIECQCMNSERVSRIAQIGIKPAEPRAKSSISFWVQFDEKSPVSQPDIELHVVLPDGSDQKQGVAFFDDGQNNDFLEDDSIYGSTVVNGFSQSGKYQYFFKAKDVFGNELQSKTEEFEVLEQAVCEMALNNGDPYKKMNIFIAGDNWKSNDNGVQEFKDSVLSVKDTFLQAKPVTDFSSSFNIIEIGQLDTIGCTGKKITHFGESFESELIDCDPQKVLSAAVSCGLPVKQAFGNFSADKIIVLHNGFYRSNTDLARSIVRVSNFSAPDSPFGVGHIAVHELGHTFGLLDFYFEGIGTALGLAAQPPEKNYACETSDATNCVMCGPTSRIAYDCTTKYRFGCNLSVNLSILDILQYGGTPFGICPLDQIWMNDYDYIKDLFSKIGGN